MRRGGASAPVSSGLHRALLPLFIAWCLSPRRRRAPSVARDALIGQACGNGGDSRLDGTRARRRGRGWPLRGDASPTVGVAEGAGAKLQAAPSRTRRELRVLPGAKVLDALHVLPSSTHAP